MHADTSHHVIKAIFTSNQSVSSLTNILGTYVAMKVSDQAQRQYHGPHWPLSCPNPDGEMYHHIMDKLETLYGKLLSDKRTVCENWVTALGPYRRQAFSKLYNINKIVCCFATEIPGGPLALPKLDGYALDHPAIARLR